MAAIRKTSVCLTFKKSKVVVGLFTLDHKSLNTVQSKKNLEDAGFPQQGPVRLLSQEQSSMISNAHSWTKTRRVEKAKYAMQQTYMYKPI